MPAEFFGQFGFTQDKLSQMLMSLQQEESERRRMQMQLAMEKARINAENARLKLAEKQFEWQQEEAVAGREAETQQTQMQQTGALAQTQMEQQGALGEAMIEQETERMKLEAPRFITVGNTVFHGNPATGEMEEAAYVPEAMILKYEERAIDKGSGILMAESEDVMQDKYYIYELKGGELVSRAPKIPTPEGTYGVNTPEGNIEFRDLETDEVVDMIMTSDPAVADQAAMLTAEAKAQEVEYDYVAEMAKIDAAKEMNWATLSSTESIEAAKRVVDNLKVALDEKRVRIEAGELVLDRGKMYLEAKTKKDRQDLDKYIANLGAKVTENVEAAKTALGYAGLDTQTFLGMIEQETVKEGRVWKAAEAVKEREFEAVEAEKGRDWARDLQITLQEMRTEGKSTPALEAMEAALAGMSPEEIADLGGRLLEAEVPTEEGEYTWKVVGDKLMVLDEKAGTVADTGVRAGEVEPVLMDIWNKVVARIKPEWYGMWGETEKQWVTSSLTVFIETDPRLTEEQRREYLTRIPELANIQIEPGYDTTLDTKGRALEWLKESAQWLFKIPPKAPAPTAVPSRSSLDAVVREAEKIAAGTGTNEEKRTRVLELYRSKGVTEEEVNTYRRKKLAK